MEAVIRRFCDIELNARDPQGDGDQTPLNGIEGNPGHALKSLWCEGGDLMQWFPRIASSNRPVDMFMLSCFVGHLEDVRHGISTLGAQSPPEASGGLGFVQDYEGVVRELLDAGARLDSKDLCGYTVMHRCCNFYAPERLLRIGAMLAQRGADVNAKHRFGDTPIMESVSVGRLRLDIVLMLLEAGADPLIQGTFGDRVSAITAAPPFSQVGEALRLTQARRELIGAGGLSGRRVELSGLSNREMNGRTGTCGELDFVRGRYQVLLDARGEEPAKSISVAFNRMKLENQNQLPKPGRSVIVTEGEHQGKRGQLQRLNADTGKWLLRLSDDSEISIAAEHFQSGIEGCGHCDRVQENLLKCAGCLRASYCSRECQRADWKQHKKSCKEHQASTDVAILDSKTPGGLAAMLQEGKIMSNLKLGGAGLKGGRVQAYSDKQDFAAGDQLVVKVQLPLDGSRSAGAFNPAGAAKVDEKKKRLNAFADANNTKNFEQLWRVHPLSRRAAVAEKGLGAGTSTGGLKAYFKANVLPGGKVSIDLSMVLPHETF